MQKTRKTGPPLSCGECQRGGRLFGGIRSRSFATENGLDSRARNMGMSGLEVIRHLMV